MLKKITRYHLLAFFIPFFIYAFLYLIFGAVYKNNFLYLDAGFQYYGEFIYYKGLFSGINTFPYTFTSSLGGTMYGAFFYVLSSPLNILVLLFDDIMFAMFIITLIKIGLLGFTMFIYLNKKMDKKYALLFSLCYAFSTYVITYLTNIMWLDALYLAPLVIYGIENMIEKNKNLMYIICMFLALISNYYMGYIVAFYAFLYFFYYLYVNNTKKTFFKDNKKLILRLIIIDILLILSVSFILVPIYFESLNFNRIGVKRIFNFVIFDFFAGTYNGTSKLDYPLNPFTFLSYAGTLINILLVSYLFDKNQNKKEKKAFIIMLLAFFLPIIIVPLNYLWHLFTIPMGFVYRYSFLYLIFILPRLYQVFLNLKYNNIIKNMLIIYIIITISFIAIIIGDPYYYGTVNYINILITILLLFINVYLIKKNKKNLLIYLLIIDLLINVSSAFIKTDFVSIKKLKENTKENKRVIEGYDSNYRIGMLNTVAYNDSMIFNYNGITNFNSNINYSNIYIICKLYENRPNKEVKTDGLVSVYYKRYDTIVDSILGIKYIGYDRLNSNYELIDTYNANGEKYFMENKYAFSIGFLASNDIKEFEFNDGLFNTNNLLNAISGNEDNFFIPIDIEKIDDKTYQINNFDKYNDYFLVYYGEYDSDDYNKFYDSEKYKADLIIYEDFAFLFNDRKEESVTLKFKELNGELKVYTYDIDKFSEYVKTIPQFNITSNKGNLVTGNIKANKDGVLVFTIPYEKGFTIYVDGKKTDYYEVMDSLIAIDIKEGEHDIKIVYKTPMLLVSIIISIISFLALILFDRLKLLKEK